MLLEQKGKNLIVITFPVKRAPGPLAAFLRLFPLSVGLHRRRYLLRHKGDRKSQ